MRSTQKSFHEYLATSNEVISDQLSVISVGTVEYRSLITDD